MPAAALRDAAATALWTLLLTAPIVGLETAGQGAVLGLVPHPGRVAALAAAAFLLRLALALIGYRRAWTGGRQGGRLAALLPRLAGPAGWAALAAALALPLVGSTQYVALGTQVLTYVMLGWGLNIVVGLAGLLDLGYVAFYGIGAYTVALLATHEGWGFWAALPAAGLAAALAGILLGIPVLRLRGDYLAIVTLGFGEIIRIVLVNWSSLTKGPNGINDIPHPSFFGLEFSRPGRGGPPGFFDVLGLPYSSAPRQIFLYFVILALALLVNLLSRRLRCLPVGRAWEALREDEIACRALGLNPTTIKLSAFATGALFGGLAGAFFAARMGQISPESFTFTESAMILAIVVLGGMGSQLGIVLAALLIVLTPELLRGFEQYRMLLFGAGMVLLMVVRPAGLMAARRPSIRLGPAGPAP